MGGSVSAASTNDELVDNLVYAQYVRSPSVENVMRSVDRGHFQQYPVNSATPYQDAAWKKGDLHLSAPCIYSEVLEALQLRPGHKFLNMGSGVGYLSTLAGLLIGPSGVNHGVELNQKCVAYAVERVEAFKQQHTQAMEMYDFCEPTFIQGDCLQIAESGTYDRIYCGAGCPDDQELYLKQLLKINGILVVPIGGFQLIRFTRYGPGLNDFQVPNIEVPSLQELSRLTVRQQIRKNLTSAQPFHCTTACDLDKTGGTQDVLSTSDLYFEGPEAVSLEDFPVEEQAALLEHLNHTPRNEETSEVCEVNMAEDRPGPIFPCCTVISEPTEFESKIDSLHLPKSLKCYLKYHKLVPDVET
ncbi:hypothetical protein B566_EDAN006977 [Ephemera danica]|nr:hypothetical protein B566_EDAN006977 [Ephemera danica]